MLLCAVLAGSGCRSSAGYAAERAALWKEAEAIEARHQALDNEIAAWSESIGAWAQKNAVTTDPARLVLSLSSRSYFLHQPPPPDAGNTDPEYAQLEHGMKEIQANQRRIEADWQALLTRDRASMDRGGLKPVERRESIEFDFGDPTIPIPGVSARARCCALTKTIDGENCKLNSEFCATPATKGGKWRHMCVYICVQPILTASKGASDASEPLRIVHAGGAVSAHSPTSR